MCTPIKSVINLPASTSNLVIDEAADRHRYDHEFFGEHKALARSLSPMLKMMKIWGLYFGCYGRAWGTSKPQATQLQQVAAEYKKKDGETISSGHATVILLIMWMNVLRLSVVFQTGNTFDSVTVNKIALILAYLECAVMHTSYFIASRSGKLDQFLNRLTVTEQFAVQLHKYVVRYIVFNSVMLVITILTNAYIMLLADNKFSFFLSPFSSLIPVDGTALIVLKAISVILNAVVVQSWSWPLAMNLVLSAILFVLFRQCNRRFIKATDRRGRLSVNLKTFRSQYQTLIDAVSIADSFIKVGNVASIVCEMVSVILTLFVLTILGLSRSDTDLSFFTTFTVNALSLAICVLSGVMVNDAVSCAGLTGHNVNDVRYFEAVVLAYYFQPNIFFENPYK
jgi:hypothetical protein